MAPSKSIPTPNPLSLDANLLPDENSLLETGEIMQCQEEWTQDRAELGLP